VASALKDFRAKGGELDVTSIPTPFRHKAGTLMIAAVLSLPLPLTVAAQTTRDACLIPSVGVIYLINVETTGEECITGHTPIALNGPLSDGSITTATLADGAVTTEKIADGTIPRPSSMQG